MSSGFLAARSVLGAWVIVGIITGWMAESARGQAFDFDSQTDAGWLRYDPLGPFGYAAVYTFPDGAYRIQSGPSPDPRMLGPSRAGSLVPGFVYADFLVRVDLLDWDDGHDQAFGLLARIASPGLGTTNGYALTYSVGDAEINLTRITGEAPAGNLAEAPVTLDRAHSYRLVFIGEGPNLFGAVYDLADLSTPLASVSTVDATYNSGILGLIAYDNTSVELGTLRADATFDNYFATAQVPEPAAALLLVGLALACGRQRRQRERGRR